MIRLGIPHIMPDLLGDRRLLALAFLAGVAVLQLFPRLPPGYLAWALLALPLGLRPAWLRMPLFFLAGFLWALWRADGLLSRELPTALERKDVVVEGTVASLPERRERGWRFAFEVLRLRYRGVDFPPLGKVRLAWYAPRIALHPGERWRLRVRLKRPHGFMNPGGFDYEAWLLQKRIRATGYVREGKRLGPPSGHAVHRLRQALGAAIGEALGPQAPLIKALVLGDRSGLSEGQWQVLRATGTAHLMAISGLHVGLVAGLAYALVGFLWRLFPRGMLLVPAPRVAASGALLAAAAYAALAGFSIPTQRALVMVGAVLWGRRAFSGHTLALALFGVLLWDPLAVLSSGFWLSFTAAWVILYALSGKRGPGFWEGLRHRPWIQGQVALGLLPLSLLFFHTASLTAPFINLVAIPWVGIGVVPLALLGSALLWPLPALGEGLLHLSAWGMALLWQGLAWCASFPPWSWSPLAWTLLPASVGIAWLLAPPGWPGRWVGALYLLPLVTLRPPAPGPGEVWMALLDVGQGLAAVVRTQRHTLVYDTGPRFSASFDAGSAVLVPFLQKAGVFAVDVLVLSHGDNDHAGGTAALMAQVPVRRVISGEPRAFPGAEPCLAGQGWSWEGVRFAFLYPFRAGLKGNRASCVLRIDHPKGGILLTGDIGKGQERRLVRRGGLESLVLVVPHHGSRTSSSPAFVQAVHPRYALFSTGYRNRFGFPHPQVVERYLREGAKVFNTALQGAILMRMAKDSFRIKAYREMARRYWHSP